MDNKEKEDMFRRAVEQFNAMSNEEFIKFAKDSGLDELYMPKEDFELAQSLKYYVNHAEDQRLACWIKENKLGDVIPTLKEDKIEPVKNPDLSSLIEICEEYVELVLKEGDIDSDLPHYIFEEALKALYGKDIFKKINA